MPKISTHHWKAHDGGPHPISGQDDGPYGEQTLGDALGISQFGVRLERLPPGSRSSHRHWHEKEDEFIYLLSGELVLIEDQESLLCAGDAAGWQAGQPVAHSLENRSEADAVMLVVGTRAAEEVVHYPDHDIVLKNGMDGKVFTRADGTPLSPKP